MNGFSAGDPNPKARARARAENGEVASKGKGVMAKSMPMVGALHQSEVDYASPWRHWGINE